MTILRIRISSQSIINQSIEKTQQRFYKNSSHTLAESDIREQGIYLLHTNKINLLTLYLCYYIYSM